MTLMRVERLPMQDYDYIFVGGGLASCLCVCRILAIQPDARVLVVEKGSTLGGQHTWSFYSDPDNPIENWDWLSSLVSHSWPRYTVRFPDFQRTLDFSYHSILSYDLDQKLRASAYAPCFLTGHEVVEISPNLVVCKTGERFSAACVIDSRDMPRTTGVGFQKFIGLDCKLAAPHGLTEPVIMDVNAHSEDGYHFFYLLPWSSTNLLLESTFYSLSPVLDKKTIMAGMHAYLDAKGWLLERIERTEQGVLPIPLKALERQPSQVPQIGVRGGFFHYTTGYSLYEAAAVANCLAQLPPSSVCPAVIHAALANLRQKILSSNAYLIGLNRMLLIGANEQQKVKIFSRFYSLSPNLVHRFYQNKLTFADKCSILFGKPPLPLVQAISALFFSAGSR